MKVALSARIPANKVTCRKTGFKAHALSGKAVRAFDLLVSYEKKFSIARCHACAVRAGNDRRFFVPCPVS